MKTSKNLFYRTYIKKCHAFYKSNETFLVLLIFIEPKKHGSH